MMVSIVAAVSFGPELPRAFMSIYINATRGFLVRLVDFAEREIPLHFIQTSILKNVKIHLYNSGFFLQSNGCP